MRSRSQTAIRSQSTPLLTTASVAEKILGSIKPIPAWADKALLRYGVELKEAYKAKDSYRAKNAEREIARIRSKVGLEGHADDRKRV
jgi:hypothetical protein